MWRWHLTVSSVIHVPFISPKQSDQTNMKTTMRWQMANVCQDQMTLYRVTYRPAIYIRQPDLFYTGPKIGQKVYYTLWLALKRESIWGSGGCAPPVWSSFSYAIFLIKLHSKLLHYALDYYIHWSLSPSKVPTQMMTTSTHFQNSVEYCIEQSIRY